VVLLHGYMDAASTWDLVAPALADAGFRVLAPDLRGFGDSPRVPAGAYYHFPDYVFDVADIVDALVPSGAPLHLVGHSMGGTIATLFAGALPERVTRMALLEGLGPPDNAHEAAPDRMRAWIEGVRALRSRAERPMASPADATRRLAVNHPQVPPVVLRGRVDALVRTLPDGRLVWKADRLHATRSPMVFFAASWKAFARRVTCRVMCVSGGPEGWHPPDEDERMACFGAVDREVIEDAGHMMHWTKPAEVASLLARFCSP